MYYFDIKFEFDPDKSEANRQKHGISLKQAREIWRGPYLDLTAKKVGELRFMAIGIIGGKCYSCVYTIRRGVIRLISARRSRKKEEVLFYERIKT